jgi:hypothetical protein
LTTEQQRVHILQRLLCALWNGEIAITGDPTSPTMIEIHPDGDPNASIRLPLYPFAGASSWANLLHAYEEWVITDNASGRRQICERFMRTLPRGLEADPQPPDAFYHTVCGLAKQEAAILADVSMTAGRASAHAELLHRFWQETMPAARDLTFKGVTHPAAGSLRALEQVVGT